MPNAVAVDLGASSGRIALGELNDGRITFKLVEQIVHEAVSRQELLRWNLDVLLGLCRRALDLASTLPNSTLGIDSWGVDHGFIGKDGKLMSDPVCYRDLSHLAAFESLKDQRPRLYELTGIQHQPFNTICQLVARKKENPRLPEEAKSWMILPDLLGYLLGGGYDSELTQASTTQLLGLDGVWSEEAFRMAGWPVPERQPSLPGHIVGSLGSGVDLVSVGSHDTASAVFGFGDLAEEEMFLNVGTWSLAGCILDRPIATPEAEKRGFTNERTIDNLIRFLKNIPGFYFINRLHGELGIKISVPDWLRSAQPLEERIDLFHPDFFNPESMLETCKSRLRTVPSEPSKWAGLALYSLADAVSQTCGELEAITGRNFKRIRVGGGGSQSDEFCAALATATGREVAAGPAESTVLGNLALQFLAQEVFLNLQEAKSAIRSSIDLKVYRP